MVVLGLNSETLFFSFPVKQKNRRHFQPVHFVIDDRDYLLDERGIRCSLSSLFELSVPGVRDKNPRRITRQGQLAPADRSPIPFRPAASVLSVSLPSPPRARVGVALLLPNQTVTRVPQP